jgi:hypothetical protein
MFTPRIIKPLEFRLKSFPNATIHELGRELAIIEKEIGEIDKIVVRAGFVLDSLLGSQPNDADLFYSLKKWQHKNWPGCRCKEIAKKITLLNLPIINSRKVDLGHILKGEVYFPPAEKVVGPFSHHIDVPAMVCIDSSGNVWGNDEALYCINNRIGEISFNCWLQHSYFSYIPDDRLFNNYAVFYTLQVFRELRMIHSKKYRSIGPNLKLLFDNCLPVLTFVLADKKLASYTKENIAEKNSSMSLKDYATALEITGVVDIKRYLEVIKLFVSNKDVK